MTAVWGLVTSLAPLHQQASCVEIWPVTSPLPEGHPPFSSIPLLGLEARGTLLPACSDTGPAACGASRPQQLL